MINDTLDFSNPKEVRASMRRGMELLKANKPSQQPFFTILTPIHYDLLLETGVITKQSQYIRGSDQMLTNLTKPTTI